MRRKAQDYSRRRRRRTRANQVRVSPASNTCTLSGIASSQSRAAQSGPTHFITSDSAGNLPRKQAQPGAAFSTAFSSATSSP